MSVFTGSVQPVRVGFLRSSQQLSVCGEKLQHILHGAKRAAAALCARHAVRLCRHDGVLQPGLLVHVILPAAENIAVARLRGGVGDIAAAMLPMPRQGKGGEEVGIRLLAPEDGVRGERPRAATASPRPRSPPAACQGRSGPAWPQSLRPSWSPTGGHTWPSPPNILRSCFFRR